MINHSLMMRLWSDERGGGAVEFSIFALIFFAMIFAALHAVMLGYTTVSLHSAVEAAARCRAMGTSCADAASTQNYALGRFHMIAGQTPTFTLDAAVGTCGYKVTGALNYSFNWVLSSRTVPLSAAACYPS